MEDAPRTPDAPAETPSEDKKEGKSSKRRRKAGEFGSIAVESKSEDKKPAKSERYVFQLDKPKEADQEKPKDFDEQVAAIANKTEAAPETEAPDEALGAAEKPLIVQEIAAIRQEELADAGEPAEPVVEDFLDHAQETGDIDAAYEAAKAEYGLEDDDIGDELEVLEAEADEADEAAEANPDDHGEFGGEEGEIDLNRAELPYDATAEDQPDDAAIPAATPAAGGGGAAGGGPGSGGTGGSAGGGSGGRPPHGRGPGGPGPGGPGGPSGASGRGFNTMPTPAIPVANRAPQQPELRRGANPATMALFGGIIGYLVGRRRGRITTERKLKPVQHKLEKEVTNLNWQLQEKEKKLQKAVAAKRQRLALPGLEDLPVPGAPIIRQEVQPKPPEQRQRAPEAHQLHGSAKAHEHIGQVLVAESAIPIIAAGGAVLRQEKAQPKREAIKQTVEHGAQIPTSTRVETLNRVELLELSEKIVVDGSSLRQIYETHLIGERGLRRLVAEHLRGGDMKKALKQEVVEREIDFERDPAMRDMPATSGGPTGGGATTTSSNATLNQMIEQAASKVGGNDEQLAYYKARTDFDAVQHEEELKQRRVLDIGITTVIAVLITIIIFVIITRAG